MKQAHVLIAGAGIGGLTAALALVRRGFRVSLYEQARELREVGAGLQVAPNGSRVLHELGLQPAMEGIVAVTSSRAMRLFNTGRTWPLLNLTDPETRYGSPFWLVHRGDLQTILIASLEQHAPEAIHLGARCVGFEQDGTGVRLLLANGADARGDVLIGADGVHSCVREILFGGGNATFMDRLPTRLRQQNFAAWLGPRAHIVTYPLRRGELLNFASSVMRDDWLIESWSQAGTIEDCRADFAQWHDDVLALIDVMETPYKWAILGRQPLPEWTVGRVSLLGDAAHPMLPFLGQGANMAIEDGMVLARCLEVSADIHAALRRYEAARLDRTSRMVLASLENGARMHNPQLADPEAAIAFMDRQYAHAAVANRYDWLYAYDAIAATI